MCTEPAGISSGLAYTDDTLFEGRLICRQHRHGYRFSVDAVLLAHFLDPKREETVLDLGAGCGVISLLLAYRWPHLRLTALELQPQLVELCRHNVVVSGYSERIAVVRGDFRTPWEVVEAGSFARVVANPPFRPAENGRVSGGVEQAMARHELAGGLTDLLGAMAFALQSKGRATLVYPAARVGVLLAALKNKGLEPKRLQMVHSHPGGRGRLVLVEAIKGGGEELVVLPPFYINTSPGGSYSAEMRRCYTP